MTPQTPHTHPLELVINVGGSVDLLNADGENVWSSDGDNDFWEFIDTDICEESDLDEILGYLADTETISDAELEEFENGGFDIFIEDAADHDDGTAGDIIEGTAEEIADETDEM